MPVTRSRSIRDLAVLSGGVDRDRKASVRILDLCCGKKSTRRAFPVVFRHFKIAYTGVDIDPDVEPDIAEDILTWDYRSHGSPGSYDIVFAWPDCRYFSDARRTAPPPAEFERAKELVRRCLEIIAYFRPRLWAMENPAGNQRHALRHQAFMAAHARFLKLTSYCAYGFAYSKPTCIWTNADIELLRCTNDTPCYHVATRGRHLQALARFSLSTRHSVPVPMLCELFDAFLHGKSVDDWPDDSHETRRRTART